MVLVALRTTLVIAVVIVVFWVPVQVNLQNLVSCTWEQNVATEIVVVLHDAFVVHVCVRGAVKNFSDLTEDLVKIN